MSVSEPEMVKVLEPFAPAEMVAPLKVTFNVPFRTLSWVEARPSTSVALMVKPPLNAKAVSSSTDCAPGTVLTGASLTALMQTS